MRFESNEEVECETEGYFGEFETSYYLEGIEKLKDRWTHYIKLTGEYIEEKNRFSSRKKILVHFITFILNTLHSEKGLIEFTKFNLLKNFRLK